MAVHLGRNDLCHCGSGKKYKRCHLDADETASRAAVASPAHRPQIPEPPVAAPPPPLVPSDQPGLIRLGDATSPGLLPRDEEMDALYTDFQRRLQEMPDADFPRQLALLDEELSTGADEEIVAESLFEMQDAIWTKALAEGASERMVEVAALVRRRRPDVYVYERIWILDWLFEDALLRRDYERLSSLVDELLHVSPGHFDQFMRIIDHLLLHDQQELVLRVLQGLWPQVREREDLFDFAKAEWAQLLTMLLLYGHHDRGGATDAADPALTAELAELPDLDSSVIQDALAILATEHPPAWGPDDFTHGEWGHFNQSADSRSWQEPDETELRYQRNLSSLVLWVLRQIHERYAIPYCRLELARDDFLDLLVRLPGARHKPARLWFTAKQLESKLAATASAFSDQPYKTVMLAVLAPRYLEIAEGLGLISPSQAADTGKALTSLRPRLLSIAGASSPDPKLRELLMAIPPFQSRKSAGRP